MHRKFFFRVLLSQLDSRQMGFKALAAELKMTESEVKTIFDNQDCSLSCMEHMCEALGLKFEELLGAIPKPTVMIQHLTQQQEIEILSNKKMCAVVLSALSYWGFHDILERLHIEKMELLSILRKLEGMGFLQLLHDDGFKLTVSKNFTWIPNGPMRRMVQSESPNYFAYAFNKPTDLMYSFTAFVKPETHDKLRSQLIEIAKEYRNQTQEQAGIAVKDKMRVAVCLATRDWVPSDVHKLLKTKP